MTFGSVISSVVLIAIIFAGVHACNKWLNSGPTVAERRNTIVAGNVKVPARQASYYKLDIKPNFSEVVAKGDFRAAGGSGNDITAYIADESNFINWDNGHNFKVLWQTDGPQTVGSFNVTLTPGVVYYLILSNRQSVVSDKTVAIDATLSFKEPVAQAP